MNYLYLYFVFSVWICIKETHHNINFRWIFSIYQFETFFFQYRIYRFYQNGISRFFELLKRHIACHFNISLYIRFFYFHF